MAESPKELRAMPLEELVEGYDKIAPSTMVDVQYYLQEIARRDSNR